MIFSVEGLESNTEVNFFNGLGFNLPKANLKCYAIGKNNSKEKTKSKLIPAIHRAQSFINESKTTKVCILFVGDFDEKQHIKTMEDTAKWAKEIIEENKDLLFKNLEVYVDDNVFGDPGLSIESSLNRSSIKLSTKNSKVGSNRNLFNDAIADSSWIVNDEFNLDEAINDLHSIGSKYADLLRIIKCFL